MSNQEIIDILKAHGIKPSVQRISVLGYLIEHRDHPSVDTIYKNLRDQIPTLSKTTVYNTLNQFVGQGIINALSIKDGEVKYDYVDHAHAHFICMVCGRIYDVELDTEIYNTTSVDNHMVTDAQINFKGICKNCKQ